MKNPKQLFLIDGIGAVASAFMLRIVLVQLESYIGIPASSLYILAAFPVLFATYDLVCYLKLNHRIGPFLKGIAMMNLSYCLLSAGLAVFHAATITLWGWTYFSAELLIVVSIAIWELKTAHSYAGS